MEYLSAEQLARAIAASINQVLPSGFQCRADEDAIGIVEAQGLDTWTCFGEILEGNPEVVFGVDQQGSDQRIASAAYAVLNSFQDFVIEGKDFRGDNWPGPRDGKLPEPGAAVINGILEMWFGDRETPALKLPSVGVQQEG